MLEKPSYERVDDLIELSDAVYESTDKIINNEPNSRTIVRIGMQAAAEALNEGYGDGLIAGDRYHAFLVSRLQLGGMALSAYSKFPKYTDSLEELPRVPNPFIKDFKLDELSQRYADVRRATLDRSYNHETDASHVVHLSALALPYAAEYYPDLDQSKIALYCLIHDLVEAYAGDVATLGADEEMLVKKKLAEDSALAKLKQEFCTDHPKLINALEDYEHLVDDESKYVKTFDKLDPKFTVIYSHGLAVIRDYKQTRDEYSLLMQDQNLKLALSYGQDYPKIIEDHRQLTQLAEEVTNWPK